MLFVTLFSEIFASLFVLQLILFTVIANRIARVLKTSGATQTVVLNISKAFYRAWHAGPLNKFWLYGVMKKLGYIALSFILLSHFVVLKDFEFF